MIREENITNDGILWDDFKSRLKAERRESRPVHAPNWKWAYGVVAALVIVAGIVVVSNISQWRNGRVEKITRDHFQINYIRIEGEPAQTYLFKPQGTDMIIVWAQKNTSGD